MNPHRHDHGFYTAPITNKRTQVQRSQRTQNLIR